MANKKLFKFIEFGYNQQNELNIFNQKSLLKKFTIILPDLRAGGAQRVALNIASVIDSNINVELILKYNDVIKIKDLFDKEDNKNYAIKKIKVLHQNMSDNRGTLNGCARYRVVHRHHRRLSG